MSHAVTALVVAFVSCTSLALSLPSRASDETGMQLPGYWHLTIHYRDAASASPEAERWDDRLWHFEKRGSRMQWTEYPIVVFEDATGRFESAAGDRTVRALASWEPNAGQLEQIRSGLVVNPRGARSKGLRGSPGRGYRSAGGLRSESTSVIGYSETWTIEGLPGAPVFSQAVSMGSGRTEDMEGRTRYAADAMSPDGREVRGSFDRDGTRHGRFVLRRAGEPTFLGVRKQSAR